MSSVTTRSFGWVVFLVALTSFATAGGCGGQATSLGQVGSKCDPATTKCGATDAGELPQPARPPCPPGTMPDGFGCTPTPGSGGARSTGGKTGSGGTPSTGGRAGSGGTPHTPDAGDSGPDADTTPPAFAGCKLVYDVSYETFRVSWDPATDDATSSSNVVYEIWVRPLGSTGDPRSAVPTTTVVGMTFADVEGLLPGTEYEVLCGAKDASGNRDAGMRLAATKTLTDGSPPSFAGIATATAGPGGTAELTWTAATDNATDSSRIVYAVYAADTSGAQDFTMPLLLTNPGATSVTVTGLATRATHYFVVRARDRAGNEDANTIEVSVMLPTSFSLDVQPIFTANCAILLCHTNGVDDTNPPDQGLNLDEGAAYTSIVNVIARTGVQISPPEPTLKRIDGTSTNPMDSYLWRKIQVPALSNIFGNTQPPPQSQRTLTSEQIQIVTDWITEGSLNN